MERRAYLFVFLLFLAPAALAADLMTCPFSGAFISLGSSIQQVIATCGQPTRQESSTTPEMVEKKTTTITYQRYQPIYNQYTRDAQGMLQISRSIGTTVPLVFNFDKDNKLIGITLGSQKINAIGSGTRMIALGDSLSTVTRAFGVLYYQWQGVEEIPQKPQDITKLIYDQTGIVAPVTLTFVDNALVTTQ